MNQPPKDDRAEGAPAERAEHQREDTRSNPMQRQGGLPQATTSPAEPGKPGPRAPHAERGPGSAGADVGMSSDGGYSADNRSTPPTKPRGS